MPNENAKIKLAAEHGTLKIVSNYTPASKTINGVDVEIEFRTIDWNNLSRKLIFYKGNQTYECQLSSTNTATIPAAVLDCTTDSEFSINACGIAEQITLTTNRVDIHINVGLRNGVYSLLSVTPILGTYNGISTIEGEIGTIKLAAKHGNLRVVKNYIPASKTVNGVKVEVDFESSEWNELTKTVAFYRDEDSYGITLSEGQNSCMVPWEILNVSKLCDCEYSINIIGTKDGVVLPTQRVKMKINLGGCLDLIYETEPTSSLYTQLLAMIYGKVDKIEGMGLSSNDYTTNEKTKLASLESDKHYVHNQMSAASIWTINHQLSKYPSISVVDSAGNLVVGDVEYINENQLKITFKSPFSGKAYLN